MRKTHTNVILPELLQVGHVHYPVMSERRVDEYHATTKHQREITLQRNHERKRLLDEQESGRHRKSHYEVQKILRAAQLEEAMSELDGDNNLA